MIFFFFFCISVSCNTLNFASGKHQNVQVERPLGSLPFMLFHIVHACVCISLYLEYSCCGEKSDKADPFDLRVFRVTWYLVKVWIRLW